MEKKVSRIPAIASREIVSARACCHRTCYKGYTRTEASHNGASDGCGESLEDESEDQPDSIRSDVLGKEKIIKLDELTELLVSYLTCLGVEDI